MTDYGNKVEQFPIISDSVMDEFRSKLGKDARLGGEQGDGQRKERVEKSPGETRFEKPVSEALPPMLQAIEGGLGKYDLFAGDRRLQTEEANRQFGVGVRESDILNLRELLRQYKTVSRSSLQPAEKREQLQKVIQEVSVLVRGFSNREPQRSTEDFPTMTY